MKRLEYECNKNKYLNQMSITECPHDEGDFEINRIGSMGCYMCEHFCDGDEYENWVDCGYTEGEE